MTTANRTIANTSHAYCRAGFVVATDLTEDELAVVATAIGGGELLDGKPARRFRALVRNHGVVLPSEEDEQGEIWRRLEAKGYARVERPGGPARATHWQVTEAGWQAWREAVASGRTLGELDATHAALIEHAVGAGRRAGSRGGRRPARYDALERNYYLTSPGDADDVIFGTMRRLGLAELTREVSSWSSSRSWRITRPGYRAWILYASASLSRYPTIAGDVAGVLALPGRAGTADMCRRAGQDRSVDRLQPRRRVPRLVRRDPR